MGWGTWHQPESELQVLGEVAGRDLLELGCGSAQWSIALARADARPVVFDGRSPGAVTTVIGQGTRK
jgi:ubiquinone/menaquinone biosynthesis C-methylase UbiE